MIIKNNGLIIFFIDHDVIMINMRSTCEHYSRINVSNNYGKKVIVIMKQGKGGGVVVMDRRTCFHKFSYAKCRTITERSNKFFRKKFPEHASKN